MFLGFIVPVVAHVAGVLAVLLYHVLCRLPTFDVKIDLEQEFVGFKLLVVVLYALLAVMLCLVIPLLLVRLLSLFKELVSIKGFAEYALE